jgi:predicted TIM-barrel fold metal-dependent hydrolase
MQYKCISVDDHVYESPDAYQKRLPKKLRENGPRILKGDGYQAWVIEDHIRAPIGGLGAVAGRKFEDYSPEPVPGGYGDVPKAYWDAAERLLIMDQDGIDAEVLFPGLAGFGGGGFFGVKDPELRSACYRAYNDHVAEDWRGIAPERFVGQCALPLYDIDQSVAELKRSYEKGHRSVMFPGDPAGFGFPPLADKAWDPLLATIQELDIPMSIHIGGGPPPAQPATAESPLRVGAKGAAEAMIVNSLSSNISSMAIIMFSGILERFPRLKVVSVESGIGWVPYFLEQCDDTYTRQRYWTKSDLRMLPSEYAARQLYWNFWNEKAGLRLLDVIGEDHVMFESDYPHSICNWPNTQKVINDICEGLSPATRQKVLADNAVRLYQLN